MNRIVRAALGLGPGDDETRAIDPSPFNVGPSIEEMGSGDGKALRLVPLYAGVSQLADAVAALPLQAYRYAPDGSRRRTDAPPLFVRPSAMGTVFDWKHRLMVSLLLRGNAYGYATGYRAGWPSSMEWLHPDYMQVDESSGVPVYRYKGVDVTSRVLHVAGFTQPGTSLGLSLVGNFGATIDAGLYAQCGIRDFHKNGSVPSHHVKNNEQVLDAAQSAEIKDRYRASVRTGEPLVTGKDWDMTPLGVSAQDAQFLDAIKANATQIAALLRTPPEDIGGVTGSSLTYATTEMQDIRYQNRALKGWVARIEAALDTITPRPVYMRFNMDSALRTDAKTRWEIHQISLATGAKTINEVRALEDLPPVPWGDAPLYSPPAPPSQTGSQA